MANNLIDRGWNRKTKLTVNKTYVSSDQTNFPVMLLWNGVTGNIPAEVFNNSSSSPKSDGRDIRFSQDYDGSIELPFEIVTFNTDSTVANARVEIHTKLTNLYTATDTTFFMWWGNGTATAYDCSSAYGCNNVWAGHFMGVYHLNESDGTVSHNSTGQFDGTYDGTSFPNRTDSSYGYVQTFVNANSNRVTIGDNPSLDMTGSMGISAVISVSSWTASWQAIVAKGDFSYRLHRFGSTNFCAFGRTLQGGAYVDASNSVNINDGNYHHVFGMFDITSGSQIYTDGTTGAIFANTTPTSTVDDPLSIGRNTFMLDRDWNGNIAEVRVYNDVKSEGWIKAEYNALLNFSSFVSTSPIDNVDFSEIGSNF